MTTGSKIKAWQIFSVLGMSLAGAANAQVGNGSFESNDFTNWTTTGYTATQQFTTTPTADGHYDSFQITPTDGTYLGLASTYHFGGTEPDPVSASSLESFLGLSAGTLNGLANPDSAIEGSGFKQTFHANAGERLSFDWDFATGETTDPINNDFGFYTLNGVAFKLADTGSSLSSVPGGASAAYDKHTGFATATITLPGTGNYTLGFGAVNVADNTISSALLIDNVHLGAGTVSAATPEPGSLSLLIGAGIGGLLLRRRHTQRK